MRVQSLIKLGFLSKVDGNHAQSVFDKFKQNRGSANSVLNPGPSCNEKPLLREHLGYRCDNDGQEYSRKARCDMKMFKEYEITGNPDQEFSETLYMLANILYHSESRLIRYYSRQCCQEIIFRDF